MNKWMYIFGLVSVVFAFLGEIHIKAAQDSLSGQINGALVISSVLVADRSIPFSQEGKINLGIFPKKIVFNFGPDTNFKTSPIRLRYKLENKENDWHEGGGEMFLAVRFYNDSGDQIDQPSFKVDRESPGWNGSLKSSALTHRRETLTVPPLASRMMIVISSAGPPATEGIYVVANLSVSKSSGKSPVTVLLQSPFDQQPDNDNLAQVPHGWTRDGNHASMAKIVKVGNDSATKAFAILDDDVASHAEWRNTIEFSPRVTPGDNLVVEWNEMYSMGVGDLRMASYADLVPGNYKFQVEELNIFGLQTGIEASLNVKVPTPFWKTSWFRGVILAAIIFVIIGGSRYAFRQKVRREMANLKHQQELERERLRIAHDIHDDLGARVTQISLLSARAQDNLALSETARADFGRISKMSRELVSALYETVWTVNPENDNLDALGNYICQMVNQLCANLQMRCRFHVKDLPRGVQVSSQIRHNISMVVKEAVHNVIKHAEASEVSIHMEFTEKLLAILVQDDGRGFQPLNSPAGHGLTNMKQRMQNIGGSCSIESIPEKGTTVHLRLVVNHETKAD